MALTTHQKMTLNTVTQALQNDGKIDAKEFENIKKVGTDQETRDSTVAREVLTPLVAANPDLVDPKLLESILKFTRGEAPAGSDPFRGLLSVGGNTASGAKGINIMLSEKLRKEGGKFDLTTGNEDPYARNWLSPARGELTRPLGSPPPLSSILSKADVQKMGTMAPGERLDLILSRTVGTLGKWDSGFQTIFTSKEFNDPTALDWSGKCFAWSYNALMEKLSVALDPPGKPGARGLFVDGVWLSRAELGNIATALAGAFAVGAGTLLSYQQDAQDLILGILGLLSKDGGGWRADIGPAKAPGEVWFQPFVDAKGTEMLPLDKNVEQQLLDVAKSNYKMGGDKAAGVMLMKAHPGFGDEQGAAFEDKGHLSKAEYNMYVFTDAQGKIIGGAMANDPALSKVANLPVRTTDAAPASMFEPDHSKWDQALDGNNEVREALKGGLYGAHMLFFFEQILGRGVSGETRVNFEADPIMKSIAGKTDPKLSEDQLKTLQAKYPTIANAYSKEEWAKFFEPLGMKRDAFTWDDNADLKSVEFLHAGKIEKPPTDDKKTEKLQITSTPGTLVPDGNASGITDAIMVNVPGKLEDVKISVDIETAFRGDITLQLIPPWGTPIKLIDRPGGGDDEGDNVRGTFGVDLQSLQSLEQLKGKNMQGTWMLRVADNFPEDRAKLVSWGMELTSSKAAA